MVMAGNERGQLRGWPSADRVFDAGAEIRCYKQAMKQGELLADRDY